MKEESIGKFRSVRTKLFATIVIVFMCILIIVVLLNSVILKIFYIFSKVNVIKSVYAQLNQYYQGGNEESLDLEAELEKVATRNEFDIVIKTDTNIVSYTTDKSFLNLARKVEAIQALAQSNDPDNILYKAKNVTIQNVTDEKTNLRYLLLTGILDNEYQLYIRMPIASIDESVKISNNLLIAIGMITVIISAFLASYISRKFTDPILELDGIAKRVANLDFSQKYQISDTEDEINNLGKSINTMSEKLESTIRQLRTNNCELEKDIQEKSKIDEMRKQFISDVSHELKTPIALIQGYAEGLKENINTDEESRNFYTDVILDETNKMDALVKQLLELMKLEYEKREFSDKEFDLTELIQETIRKSQVLLNEKQIQVKFDSEETRMVYADSFYVEQVFNNYFTNAIKNCDTYNQEKYIEISFKKKKDQLRIFVFNTGSNIPEEDLDRIWRRFYKADTSRNRENGGSGIGLSLVKAIMENYGNAYGVENQYNGVEFYFDLNTKPKEEEEKKEEK